MIDLLNNYFDIKSLKKKLAKKTICTFRVYKQNAVLLFNQVWITWNLRSQIKLNAKIYLKNVSKCLKVKMCYNKL